MTEEETKGIGFNELLSTTRVVDSKNRQVKLGKCIDFELSELLQAINKLGKAGSMTIDLKILVGDGNELGIQATVKTKKPNRKTPTNPYYTDVHGNLYLDDPEQLRLFSSNVTTIREDKGETNNA